MLSSFCRFSAKHIVCFALCSFDRGASEFLSAPDFAACQPLFPGDINLKGESYALSKVVSCFFSAFFCLLSSASAQQTSANSASVAPTLVNFTRSANRRNTTNTLGYRLISEPK